MGSLGIQKLKVVALAVADLPRAMHFYGETLGLPPAFEGASGWLQSGQCHRDADVPG